MTTEVLRTIPVSRTSVPDLEKMVELTKTYENGQVTTLYAGAGGASRRSVDAVEPLFFKNPHGKRESVSWHQSGFIVSGTDIVSRPSVRRRALFMLVWSPNDKHWMTWSVGKVSSVAQGKRLIDNILRTGILPE